jgi:hypothetical protein
VLPEDATRAHLHRLVEVCQAHVRCVMDYQPMDFGEPVLLYRPADTTALSEASGQSLCEDLGWGRVVGDRLITRIVPGDHFSMMTGDHAAELGRDLAKHLHAIPATGMREAVASD